MAALPSQPPTRVPLAIVCLYLLDCEAEYLPLLVPLLESNDPCGVKWAWRCISILGDKAAPITDALRPFLNNPDYHWRVEAFIAAEDPEVREKMVAMACELASNEACQVDDSPEAGQPYTRAVGVLMGLTEALQPDQIQRLLNVANPKKLLGLYEAMGPQAQVHVPLLIQEFEDDETDYFRKLDLIRILGKFGGETVFEFLEKHAAIWRNRCIEALLPYGERGLRVIERTLYEVEDCNWGDLFCNLVRDEGILPRRFGDLVEPFLEHENLRLKCYAARLILFCRPEPERVVRIARFFFDHLAVMNGTMPFFFELARPLAQKIAEILEEPNRLSEADVCFLIAVLGRVFPYGKIYERLLARLYQEGDSASIRMAARDAHGQIWQADPGFAPLFFLFHRRPSIKIETWNGWAL